jgi:hypothetical protein
VTPLGHDTLANIRELNTRHLRTLFAAISDADLAVLEQATRIMADAIDLTSPDPDSHPDPEPSAPPATPSGSHE